MHVRGPAAAHGLPQGTPEEIDAEVVGFRGSTTLLMPHGDLHGVAPLQPVIALRRPFAVPVGDDLPPSLQLEAGAPQAVEQEQRTSSRLRKLLVGIGLLTLVALVAGGIAIAVAGSWILSRYFPVLEVTTNSQILSRVSPTTVDLMIALAAGAAGAFAISRPDVSDSLPGVAIAVALVPPLTVIGITLEAAQWDFALGATLLFLTNFVGVIFAAGVTFVLVGFSPWFHVEANRSQINRSYATVVVALLLLAIPLTIAGDERSQDRVLREFLDFAERRRRVPRPPCRTSGPA